MAARDISPFLSRLRGILLGRDHANNLRFAPALATRSPDPPTIPPGPSHKLAGNYYFTRDARREVHPPTVLSDNTKAITSGEGAVAAAPVKSRAPGAQYNYSNFGPESP
eukprot:TRINITY_DN14271_c0_g1_i1.p1 TRINITY_DN14271_c0_g1~~TRINITY_DN14271_c0_g1_i1.p1  ORF type:complete len:109 (-),score=12.88 TRINITY_DN14271_c0_g1_i1:31-357(-)